MSDDSKRRRGQPSRYLNGGTNALMRAPSAPGDEQNGDEQNGGWSHAQLTRMDSDFVAALERAIAAGKESLQAATHGAKETRPR